MRCVSGLLLLLCVAAAFPALAQKFDMQRDRLPVAELKGQFRFHTGDDPDGKLGWADPGFDDSKWSLLKSDQSWYDQGYKNYGGMAWYRFQVAIPATHPPLALYLPELATSYQVFANGRMIHQFGGMPPHAQADNSLPQLAPIPEDSLTAGNPLTIAIRVWHAPNWAMFAGGGPYGTVRIGDASALRIQSDLVFKEAFWHQAANGVMLLVYVLAGLAGVALFLLGRDGREYLWFGLCELIMTGVTVLAIWPVFLPIGYMKAEAMEKFLVMLAYLFLLAFLFRVLRQPRGWLYWAAIGSAVLLFLAGIPGELQWTSMASGVMALGLAYLLLAACIVILLIAGARRGNEDARLLLIPFGLSCALHFIGFAFGTAVLTGAPLSGWVSTVNGRYNQVSTWPFPFSVPQGADFLFELALLGVLLLRFARIRREQQRLASELEAAREVQHVLVPDEVPAVPGFPIDCIYRPASEVGGDFFQIIALPEGGALAAIGDVSGKGMPAAMTVSLLVGTLRTLVHYTHQPAEILAAMNQRLLGRASGGFTTCLVARLEADGRCTIANAGHLPPYADGREIGVDNGLPLGLTPHSEYTATQLTLSPGSRLTFLTDGVVEAQSPTGELYGFDRTRDISTQSAEAIAAAAQSFGQEDDITVLTLSFSPIATDMA